MWGESSKNCEINCQCSGLITEKFKINSGNNATKRKQEDAATHNYKTKMNPHSLDFNTSPISPNINHSKRRILGEIQNSLFKGSPLKNTIFKPSSPLIDRLKSPLSEIRSPVNHKSPILSFNSPRNSHNSCKIDNLYNNPPQLSQNSPKCVTHNTPIFGSTLHNSPKLSNSSHNTPKIANNSQNFKHSPYNTSIAQNIIDRRSPLTSRSFKRTSKITRIFEDRTNFKMSNKENCEPLMSETLIKLDMEEETRDCSFGEKFQTTREKVENWSMTKLDFTNLQSTFQTEMTESYVPEKDIEQIDEFATLHDLEEEFDADNFDTCTKYEIISTDSPNIISRGRTSSSRKVNSRNFVFGAPLAENEPSTSFNKPNTSATRMLNFEEENFEFTSPAVKKSNVSVKKSLKFNETPTKNPLRHEKSDSSIGSMSGSMSMSPSSTKSRIFTSESTTSMESGFISELEEPFLEIEESNSPKMANFNDLLSGQIKNNIVIDKRKSLCRSLSFNPESKAKVSLFSIMENPKEKKSCKRAEESEADISRKRRRSNCHTPEIERLQRPVLQRAFSENNASIMSALARSAVEPDLIGDFTLPFALPLTSGDHSDLKSISCDTLAGLISGEYEDTISDFQVIDCRYPYEYEGGHILGALNLYTPAQVQALVNKPLERSEDGARRNVLVFHCEFSIERGPKLSRFLRSSDREKNQENYPLLHYPEVYLLHEGYRSFYQKYPDLCSPVGYTAMLDPKHRHMLKKHRSISQPSTSAHLRRNRLLL